MEALWLPTILNMLADVPQQCPIIKDLVMDVSVGQILKGLQYLHLTLWWLSSVCYVDRGSLPQSVRCWWWQLEHLYQRSTSSIGRNGQVGVLNRVYQSVPSLPPKLANFLLHLFQVSLAWHTIGIYCPAISAFLEPHGLHKASDHPVISKLMHHFYLQHPPSCKWFDPWDVKDLLSLLESRAPASSPTTFKLAWKTSTILALVTAKHCSDLTLLCIDNQPLYLQNNDVIFIPMSGGKTDHPGHLPPQVCIESHSNVNLCPVFYLKAFLRFTELFRIKPDGSCVTSLFLGNSREHQPVCAKTISSWVRKVLCVAKAHMSLGCLWGLLLLQPWQLVFPQWPSCRQVTGPKFLHQLGTISPLHYYYRLAPGLCIACWARSSPGKCQTLTYTQSCICWAVGL